MGNVSTVHVKYIMSRDGVKRDSFIDKTEMITREMIHKRDTYRSCINLHIKQQIFLFVCERKMKYIKCFHHPEMTSHLLGSAY